MKLIDKDAVVAEIKKLVRKNELYLDDNVSDVVRYQKAGAYSVLNDLLHFLNTSEVKEVDLEKAIDDYIYTHDGRKRLALELDWKCCNLTLKGCDEIIKFAKHFYSLGLAQKGEKV